MLDSVVSLMWPEGMSRHTYITDGEDLTSKKKNRGGFYSIQDLVYKTVDGYITCGTVTMKEWVALCSALDKPDWLADARFKTAAGLSQNREERLALIGKAISELKSADALARLDAAGVPCGPVNTRSMLLNDPQGIANSSVTRHKHHLVTERRILVLLSTWP